MDPNSRILFTKFVAPRISTRKIDRIKLESRIREFRDKKLLVICAGPGFGKTTLLVQWRRELLSSGGIVAWVSLDQGDDCPRQLLLTLAEAFKRCDAGSAGYELGDLSSELTVEALINGIGRVRRDLVLMLDNFQKLQSAAAIRTIQALLDASLSNLRVVVASRGDPLLPRGRLRASGKLVELDSGDLSFSMDELQMLLRSRLRGAVDMDLATEIHDLTRGWPIGVELVVQAINDGYRQMRLRDGMAPLDEAINDYLTEDVLTDVPATLFAFMQKLAVLHRFDGALAEFLFGTGAAVQLESIDRSNLFILPKEHGQGRTWYRFHPMIRSFLYKKLLQHRVDPEEIRGRAATWFAEQGFMDDAIGLAMEQQDLGSAVEFIANSDNVLSAVNWSLKFSRWAASAPDERFERQPRLLLAASWACAIIGLSAEAEVWLEKLARSRLAAECESQMVLIKAMIAMLRDDQTHAYTLLQSVSGALPESVALNQLRMGMMAACLSFQGFHKEARKVFIGLSETLETDRASEPTLMAMGMVSAGWLQAGDVRRAARITAEVLAKAELRHGRASISASLCAAVRALALYELDQLDAAEFVLANRMPMVPHLGPNVGIYASLAHARLIALRQSVNHAVEYLAKAEHDFRGRGIFRGVSYMVAEQLRLALSIGDWRHAEQHQLVLDELAMHHLGKTPRETDIGMNACIGSARLALADHRPESALMMLSRTRVDASRLQREAVLVLIDVLEALALADQQRHVEAIARLELAVAAGYRLGLTRTFLDEGEKLASLLRFLEPRADFAFQAYLDHLRFGKVPDAPPVPAETSVQPTFGEGGALPELTRRERQIVELLQQNMPDKRIALALNISVNTVKWNLRRIFAKLGVTGRYELIMLTRSWEGKDRTP